MPRKTVSSSDKHANVSCGMKSTSSKRRDDQADTPNPKKPKLNKTDSDLSSLVLTCSTPTKDGRSANFKITSWNVAGIRACVKKNGMEYIKKEDADIMCLQEIKCSKDKLPPDVNIEGYHTYWCLGTKEGYAGVGVYSKQKALTVKYGLGIQDYDAEGRLITAEYENFYLVVTYVPNAGQGLKNLPRRLQWDEDFRKYLKSLDEKKPIILCGDMNVSHKEIDLANPKTNTKSAGFTVEEREGMTLLLNEGFVDTFRLLYPDVTGAYTYWTYLGNARSRNVGWRLDYFILSERFVENVCDTVIRNEVYGSDHCPIVLYLSV